MPDFLATAIERTVSGPMWHGPSLRELLADVTLEEANARPIAGAHSIGELVAHIIAWVEIPHERLRGGGKAAPDPAEDWPPVGRLDATAWRALLDRLEAVHRALAAAVRDLRDAELDAMMPGRDHTLGDMLHGVVAHGTYHGGQVAILKRALRGSA